METRPQNSMIALGCATLLFVGCGEVGNVSGPSDTERQPTSVEAADARTSSDEGTTFVSLRKEWQPTAKPRDWKHIVLHHTATDRGSVESIHEVHRQRKDAAGNAWLGIGYHFVVGNGDGMRDGLVEPTFRWRGQLHGAHAGNREYNEQGIGIVLVGNFEKQAPSPAQRRSLEALIASLSSEFDIPAKNVVPHRDLKATACPGKYFPLHDTAFAAMEEAWPKTDGRPAPHAALADARAADTRGIDDEDETP